MSSLNLSEINIEFWNETDIYLWLQEILGNRRQPLSLAIFLTIVYIIIFVTGVVGNVSTFVVIARNKYMHTATNYYLCNLVISDLLQLLLGLPQEAYAFWSAYPWVFGEAFCTLRTMAAETATYASILTITAFTVERYVAICHPMKAKVMSGLRRAINTIALVWVVAGCSSIPIWIQYGVVHIADGKGNIVRQSAVCTVRHEKRINHIFELSSVVFFVIPVTIISILYGLIGLSIRKSTLSHQESYNTANRNKRGKDDVRKGTSDSTQQWRAVQQAKSRLSVLKMLVAVVVAFFICWAPFHVQRLLFTYMSGKQYPGEAVFFYISGILYFVSAVINPILYNIMSLKFRQAFVDTLCHPYSRRSARLGVYISRTGSTYRTPTMGRHAPSELSINSPTERKSYRFVNHQSDSEKSANHRKDDNHVTCSRNRPQQSGSIRSYDRIGYIRGTSVGVYNSGGSQGEEYGETRLTEGGIETAGSETDGEGLSVINGGAGKKYSMNWFRLLPARDGSRNKHVSTRIE